MYDYVIPHIPQTSRKRILFICEGQEEEAYIKKLKELNVFSDNYEIDTVNAEGNGSLVTHYTVSYQSSDYDLILLFCDTDKYPYKQFEKEIRERMIDFTGSETAADSVIIFGNPCTMQIVISHFWSVASEIRSKEDKS